MRQGLDACMKCRRVLCSVDLMAHWEGLGMRGVDWLVAGNSLGGAVWRGLWWFDNGLDCGIPEGLRLVFTMGVVCQSG
jgi:hypothetical protein